MRYEAIILERGDDGVLLKVTVLLSTDSKEVLTNFQERGRAAVGGTPNTFVSSPVRRGPKGRKVQVLAVEEDCGSVLRPGDVFDSASDASRALGKTYNVVGVELAKVKGTEFPSAVIDGVEFIYQDDMPGRD